MLAYKQTHCKNLLLLTDHEYGELEVNGVKITIQPVYDYII